jgi:hypothetical protein
MARMVGVWMYVAPRRPSDNVNLTGGATIILTEADKRKPTYSKKFVKLLALGHSAALTRAASDAYEFSGDGRHPARSFKRALCTSEAAF